MQKVAGNSLQQLPAIDGILVAENVYCHPLMASKTEGYDFEGGITRLNESALVIESALIRHGRIVQIGPGNNPPKTGVIKHMTGTFYFGGVLLNNYGHFLLESLSRLWAYPLLKNDQLPIVFFCPWGIPDLNNKNHYITQAFKSLGIPTKRILFIVEQVSLEKIIIAEQKYGFGKCLNPDGVFMNFIRSFSHPVTRQPAQSLYRNIYVSRSELPYSQGRPIGEKIFEAFLAQNGYTIVYPEKLTLYQQLAIYQTAEKIIFCDGGATYSMILLPDVRAKIAIIARRRDPRWNYIEITEHFKGNQQSITWIDEVLCQYQFGLESWDALAWIDWIKISELLVHAGFLSQPFPTENKISEADIQKEIAAYIQSIQNNPNFLGFMALLKNDYPILPSSFDYSGTTPADHNTTI